MSRAGPHGTPGGEIASRLRDAESMAMLGRKGAWKSANAGKLVELRAAERREANELKAISAEINAPEENVDINKASLTELESLPGIGVVTGKRIISGRPYTNLNQLLDVPGITSNKLKRLRQYLVDI
jgi:competence protein ComEA